MIFNCGNCYRCCTHFTKIWMGPYLNLSEIEVKELKKFSTRILIEGQEYTVLKPVENRCPLWTYTGKNHCRVYDVRPQECRLYPFLVKNGEMIIHLTCPDAVRMLQLLDAGDVEAERVYKDAKNIIANASEKHLRFLEWQTRNFQFYCVVK